MLLFFFATVTVWNVNSIYSVSNMDDCQFAKEKFVTKDKVIRVIRKDSYQFKERC